MAVRGELEQRVLEVLWDGHRAMRVADVLEIVSKERNLAYTTVMTVLDRLSKKNLVTRELRDRAWCYQPSLSQSELTAHELFGLVRNLRPEVRREALELFAQRLSDEDAAVLGQ